ncbi:MAG TPA: TFIIB-type zinc ribbon-containing protein [Acidilobales archaeon]|nr:TFIIB-type zinc ribbon-containing protein [Acidilobales archaeon]
MKCPECGSVELVWDYKGGCVVCSACGLVIDSIYVNQVNGFRDEGLENARMKAKEKVKTHKKLKVLGDQEMAKRFKLYMDLLNNKRVKLAFETKALTEFIYGKRAPVKILVKRGTKIDESLKTRLSAIINIINKYPRLASRTDRAKYALAYMIYSLINTGRIDFKEVTRKFNLSFAHARRLYSQLSSEVINEAKYVMKELIEPTPVIT